MSYIQITIIYALPEEQFFEKIKIATNSTVEQALIKSKIFNKVKKKINKIGIYGKIVQLKQILKNNDRIELYRKLIVSPMDQRRKKIKLKNN